MSKLKLFLVTLLVLTLLPLGVVRAQEEEVPVDDTPILYQDPTTDEAPDEYMYTTDEGTDWDWEWDYDTADDLLYTTQGQDAADVAAGLLGAGFMALFAGVYMLFAIVFGLGGYIFSALALMKIGKEMGYENPWFAWIPILNSIMMLQLGGQNPWLLLLLLIPGIGAFIVMIISIIALANITEKRGYEKLLVLLILIPFGMFVLLYLLAWKPKSNTSTPKVESTPAQETTPTM
ncbi:hypothetical protein CVU76_01575 [Candidatus Dojkabacteria bacterium HGW-Dojkabacteria-1]|uniref:Yip1 domain-containing protein n=1 Tax=Candidatus Dojkabacteria bacterium HGW-Dojkabacteria-1 TaxID=2013761 RepID=A0A2N2F3H4_9BACT|nr:MAG: hypothetical protein CVU76_01575 [Candidatus Dojkabacteria bacterium HGW-Dojkabacteria-1]